MPYLPFTFAFVLVSLCACTPPSEPPEADALRQENKQLTARADSLEQALAILEQETSKDSTAAAGTLLRADDLAYLRGRGLSNPVTDLRADLLRNPELIPLEGVLGGTMRFSEDGVRVLNRRWVLAYFEDGHNAGDVLLRYTVKNGKITWKVMHAEPL